MTTIIVLNIIMIVLAFGTVAGGLAIGFRLKPRTSRERRTVLPGSRDSYRIPAGYRLPASATRSWLTNRGANGYR
jgi:hypothetical protein